MCRLRNIHKTINQKALHVTLKPTITYSGVCLIKSYDNRKTIKIHPSSLERDHASYESCSVKTLHFILYLYILHAINDKLFSKIIVYFLMIKIKPTIIFHVTFLSSTSTILHQSCMHNQHSKNAIFHYMFLRVFS